VPRAVRTPPGRRSTSQSKAPAVTRAAAILELLAEHANAPVGTSDLARRLSIPKSSATYLVEALVEAGLARREPGGYQLGHRLVGLGAAYVDSVDRVRAFHSVCGDICPALPETVQLSTLDRSLDVVYLAKRGGTHPVRLAADVGLRLFATTTATGKAMLSGLPWEDVKSRVAAAGGLPRPTSRSINTLTKLRAELERIRDSGYSVDDEETLEGMFCIGRQIPTADPLRDPCGISLTLLKAWATEARIKRCRRDLDAIATELARRTGVSMNGPR
jgi:IclR family transcriptional regulator, blcABC operon repressor